MSTSVFRAVLSKGCTMSSTGRGFALDLYGLRVFELDLHEDRVVLDWSYNSALTLSWINRGLLLAGVDGQVVQRGGAVVLELAAGFWDVAWVRDGEGDEITGAVVYIGANDEYAVNHAGGAFGGAE